MKKLIVLLVVVGAILLGEIILPKIITQTFYLIDSAPGNPPVTLPHWRLETWMPRYNVGIAIILLGAAGYILFSSLKKRKKN